MHISIQLYAEPFVLPCLPYPSPYAMQLGIVHNEQVVQEWAPLEANRRNIPLSVRAASITVLADELFGTKLVYQIFVKLIVLFSESYGADLPHQQASLVALNTVIECCVPAKSSLQSATLCAMHKDGYMLGTYWVAICIWEWPISKLCALLFHLLLFVEHIWTWKNWYTQYWSFQEPRFNCTRK